jgi:hypothetical protein
VNANRRPAFQTDRIFSRGPYISAMPSKPIELPPRVAQAFVKDMRAFLATQNTLKQDVRPHLSQSG